MAEKNKNPGRIFWAILIFVILVVVIVGLFWLWLRPSGLTSANLSAAVYTVTRGDMLVSVTESGNIKALNAVEIKSEVEGQTTIISIVDEGTIITQEDVDRGWFWWNWIRRTLKNV